MLKRFACIIISSLCALTAPLLASESTAQISENLSPSGQSVFVPKLSLNISHYNGFKDDIDDVTVFVGGATWALGDFNLGLSQKLSKYYYINPGDEELLPSDTVVSLSKTFKDFDLWGFTPKLGLSTSLPVSEFSRKQGVLTKTNLAVNLSRKFFNDKLSYSVTANGTYITNRYKTTVTDLGANGGNPLRHYLYNLDQVLSYAFNKFWSLSAQLVYVKINYHDIGFRNRVSNADSNRFLGSEYSAAAELAYTVNEKLSWTMGYDQSDEVEKTGGVREAYLFDRYNTSWYLGASVAL